MTDPTDVTVPTTGLPAALAEWTDFDVAAFALGRALGVFAAADSFQRVKGVFWNSTPLGNALHETLCALVAGGILEEKAGDDGIHRWSRTQPARRNA